MRKRMTHIPGLLPFGEPWDYKELSGPKKVDIIEEQWRILEWKERVRNKDKKVKE
jgi:hypothetical protein